MATTFSSIETQARRHLNEPSNAPPARGRGSKITRNLLLTVGIKRCARCSELRHLDDFARGGRKSYCRPCYAIKGKEHYYKHREAKRRLVPPEYKTCVACKQLKEGASFDRSPGSADGLVSSCKPCLKLYRRELRFGVRYLAASCEACKRSEPEVKLVPDHCHVSNLFRGTLCSNCNTALGLLKDNPQSIKGLLEYTKTWQRY